MKLSCGYTREYKLKQQKKKLEDKVAQMSKWRRKFAWFPVRIDSYTESASVDKKLCLWLEFYEERWYDAYVKWDYEYDIYFIVVEEIIKREIKNDCK